MSQSDCLCQLLALCFLVGSVHSGRAGDVTFYDPMDGTFALRATSPAGVVESAVPIFHNGSLVGGQNHKVIEIYDQVPPATGSFPLTVVDLAANSFLRVTYQTPNGGTGALGTSVVGTASYRTADGLHYVPSVTRADVTTGGPDRYRNDIQGSFGEDAAIQSSRSYPNDPLISQTEVALSIQFESLRPIALATGAPFAGNDRLRMMTLSSMFAGEAVFDANVLRYDDPSGQVHSFRLTDSTPRDAHLFEAPVAIGSWFELIKEPGSSWFPDSPTIRIELGEHTPSLTLGLQGYLAGSKLPTDDSLSVWVELMNAPDVIPSNAQFHLDTMVVSLPPVLVPEPSAFALAAAGALTVALCRRRSLVIAVLQRSAGTPSGRKLAALWDRARRPNCPEASRPFHQGGDLLPKS